ncbi:CsgG/HfaB family protein [Synechococcus sp. Cu2B8-bc1011]|uniref:CsgG/HfaB family protein n=1 Tax=Synechococcus sp. Cu2B8-bc1011 TaxID=3093725 RepID=UPI0039AED07D
MTIDSIYFGKAVVYILRESWLIYLLILIVMKERTAAIFPSFFIGLAFVGSFASIAGPTVSVPDFKNEVGQLAWWSPRVSRQLADALSNELSAAGGLTVVERQNVKAVLSEQEMAELGIVRKNDRAAKSGQMTGSQYVILGRVSGYENNVETKQSGSGMRFLGFGGSKDVAETKAYVSLDLRIVDTTTGEVVGYKTVEGRAKNTAKVKGSGGSLAPLAGLVGGLTGAGGAYGLAAAGTFGFNESSSETKKTPASKAVRAALIAASDYVSCVLVRKDQCLDDYARGDVQRRQNTLDVLEMD